MQLMPTAELLSPILIMVLCVIAGLGTIMLLPGKHEIAFHRIGGVILAAAGLIFVAMLPKLAVGSGQPTTAIYFWIFSAIALVGAIRVVTHPRPVYSALYFVMTVFATAGLFVLLEAEFVAAALVLIYAGAILVTYVFVIMLASQAGPDDKPTVAQKMIDYDRVSKEPLAAAAIGFALMGVLLFLIFDRAAGLAPPAGVALPPRGASADVVVVNAPGITQQLGLFLFRNQLVQLELAGLILTIAMVGAIVISRRQVFVAGRISTMGETVIGPATPIDDNPHSIPVYGTDNPRQKSYPQT